MKLQSLYLFFLFLNIHYSHAKLIKYEFDINTKEVSFAGKKRIALAINNQIPGPTIEATVGDTLQVTFNNKLSEETSIHWHGILLPSDQDGVPYLNTPPIQPNSSFTFKYPIKHAGTYWYHSHSRLQEQLGMYGALVFHPTNGEVIKTDYDYVVVLSDWNNDSPYDTFAKLKKDGDYFSLKKNTVLSWNKVLMYGAKAIKQRLIGAATRMGPMDLSDVGYDAFLANGQKETILPAVKNSTVRVRIINASTASYFNLESASGPMTIASADGVDVEPIKVKRLLIAIAETYDLIISMPDNNLYELRASSEDGTGMSSVFIGNGEKKLAPTIEKPNLFIIDESKHTMNPDSSMFMKMNMSMNMPMPNHQDSLETTPSVIQHMTNYNYLAATQKTSFDKTKPQRKIKLNITGNMDGYFWGFDGKTLRESPKIWIEKGEVVQIEFNNKTMMHHPIHLHGHFFRVLNQQGDKSPLKHTVNVPSMSNMTIEFEATEENDWFLHCHNLYHMTAGLARVVSYKKTSIASKETIYHISHNDLYLRTKSAVLSNMIAGISRLSDTRNIFEIKYDFDYKSSYDIEMSYGRRLTKYLELYAGGELEYDKTTNKKRHVGTFGVRYVIPLLITSNLRIDTTGRVQLEVESSLQLTKRLLFEWLYNTNQEYRFNFLWALNKNILFIGTYDSDYQWGGGVRFEF